MNVCQLIIINGSIIILCVKARPIFKRLRRLDNLPPVSKYVKNEFSYVLPGLFIKICDTCTFDFHACVLVHVTILQLKAVLLLWLSRIRYRTNSSTIHLQYITNLLKFSFINVFIYLFLIKKISIY